MVRRLIVMAVLAALCLLTGCAAPNEAAPTASPTVSPTPETSVEPTPSPTAVPMEVLFDIVVHPPTCQTNGYSVYVNKESGGINIRDEIPRLPHEWIERDGKTVCKNCGVERNEQN